MTTAMTVHEGTAPVPLDPYQMMDRWDEDAMLAEMNGAIAKSLVYEFKQGGETITGLSKIGVDECCAALIHQGQVIRELDVEYAVTGEGDEREALFKAKAARYSVTTDGREVLLDTVIGVKREPLYRETRHGKQFNPHWFETGAMKATRNARFRLIPAKVREGVIAAAKQAGQVRTGGGQRVDSDGVVNGDGPSEKQLGLYDKLAANPVFTEDERATFTKKRATLTRQTVSKAIDYMKQEVEARVQG